MWERLSPIVLTVFRFVFWSRKSIFRFVYSMLYFILFMLKLKGNSSRFVLTDAYSGSTFENPLSMFANICRGGGFEVNVEATIPF